MIRLPLSVLALLAALVSPPMQAQEPAAEDRAGLLAAFDEARHALAEADGGHIGLNPGQRWRTHFDGRGFATEPDSCDWTWGLELVGYGWTDAPRGVTQPVEVLADGQRLAYRWDELLTEWFVNDRRGLEHGFTLSERPAEASGALSLTLAVRGGLLPVVSASGRDIGFVDGRGITALTYAGLTVLDADGHALPAG